MPDEAVAVFTPGRGGWSKIGMPSNGTGYYELLTPVNVGSQPTLDFSHEAVMYGVKALQTRINELGYLPALDPDGWFGPKTGAGALWVQTKMHVAVDGQIGPRTSVAMFWPVIKQIAGANAQVIGGIASHESQFDPGAVGASTPEDLGLVQINGPNNPTLSVAQRFDYRFAFKYASDRIAAALAHYHNADYAIASYYVPAWADQWQATGHPPNPLVVAFVDYVRHWVPPFA